MTAFLVFLALHLLPHAGPANQVQAESTKGNCTITGVVESAGSGTPLQYAVISMDRADKEGRSENYQGGGIVPRALTDAAGRFEIKDIAPGRYIISASAPGYVPLQYGEPVLEGALKLMTISPGETVQISFLLERGAVIAGHVHNEDGEPVEHAHVMTAQKRPGPGREPYLMPVGGGATTNDRGEFRLFDLPAGKYYVSVTPSWANFSDSLSLPTSYYPGVPDSSDAQPIAVRAGQVVSDINFTLRRLNIFHVRGRVINTATDAPVTSVGLTLIRRKEGELDITVAGLVKNAQGEFDFAGIPAGRYLLYARLMDRGNTYGAQQIVTVADSDADGVRLVVTAGVKISATLRTEDLPGAFSLNVGLSPQAPTASNPRLVTLRPGETLDLDALSDGTYVLTTFGVIGNPRNTYVKSATLGSQDVLDSNIEITGGKAPGSTLRIVVSGNAGRVEGTAVLKGQPLRDAAITLARADYSNLKNRWWTKDAVTDAHGNFTIEGIRPGKYRIFAWEKPPYGLFTYPGFLERHEAQGRLIDVAPGGTLNLHLDVIPAKDIPGSDLF